MYSVFFGAWLASVCVALARIPADSLECEVIMLMIRKKAYLEDPRSSRISSLIRPSNFAEIQQTVCGCSTRAMFYSKGFPKPGSIKWY